MWGLVAAERRRTADFLETLQPEHWQAPSLCELWTVREDMGHINFIWNTTDEELMERVGRHGGDVPAASAELGKELGRKTPEELIAGLRDNAELQKLPPGARPIDALADVVLHTHDVAFPLGLEHPANADATWLVLDEVVGDNRDHYNPSDGIDGLRFEATDLDWSHGEGDLVKGRAIDLASALHGRRAPVDALTGPGVEAFRERFGNA